MNNQKSQQTRLRERVKVFDNTYGHGKRLRWIVSHLRDDDVIIEVGCGTGMMVVMPLAAAGYNIRGVDLDEASIEAGRKYFETEGGDPQRLQCVDVRTFDPVDVIILSEVLEHNDDESIGVLLESIGQVLKPNGRLLVTVPHGYGWFELESFLWHRCGIGRVISACRIDWLIASFKSLFLGRGFDISSPSTLSHTPHVQTFTRESIAKCLADHGYKVKEIRTSSLFAGPFSEMLIGGIRPLLRFNHWLGGLLPALAAGVYVACHKLSTVHSNGVIDGG